MLKRIFLSLCIAMIAIFYTFGDIQFSIRYYDKTIYYPNDTVSLKLTISNNGSSEAQDETFFLADDLRQSFGFDLRSITGVPAEQSEGYSWALKNPGAYRVIHLSPGQELSMIVSLNDWVLIEEPEQYLLSGFFYPHLRGSSMDVTQAISMLDLTIIPNTDSRSNDKLTEEVRNMLIKRDLDPWGVVKETFENRATSKFNRAIIYLDTESIINFLPNISDPKYLEGLLLNGSWQGLPGFEHPSTNLQHLSSRIFENEAIVIIKVSYAHHGQIYSQNLMVYLNKRMGYWAIRRIETTDKDAGALRYNIKSLSPPEIVSSLVQAAIKGDWDNVLRFFDITNITKNLPENIERWENMSTTEQNRALMDYRRRLIAGEISANQLPLQELENWKISHVNYTMASGSVVVRNLKTYTTLNGPLEQESFYTFYLEYPQELDRWIVVNYNVARTF